MGDGRWDESRLKGDEMVDGMVDDKL